MHHSDDINNFRNKKYIEECAKNEKEFARSFHKYIAYRNKLLNELTLSEEQKKELADIDRKFGNNMLRNYRIAKKDGLFEDEKLKEYENNKIIKEFYQK